MKKIILLFSLLFGLFGCGDTSEVKIGEYESDEYTKKDIESAIETTITYFKIHFNGCKLTYINYAGDIQSDSHKDVLNRENADEVIVLTSTFDVDSSGGDGSLNPDYTYKGWKWILVRNTGGKWRHADHGY